MSFCLRKMYCLFSICALLPRVSLIILAAIFSNLKAKTTFWRHFYQLSLLAYFGISFSACYNYRACSFSAPYRFHFNFSCWSSFCNSFVLRLIAGVKPRANSTKAGVRRSGAAALHHLPDRCGWCPDNSHGGHLLIFFQRLQDSLLFLDCWVYISISWFSPMLNFSFPSTLSSTSC